MEKKKTMKGGKKQTMPKKPDAIKGKRKKG